MKTSTWKATERAIAKRLGGQRNPITGRQRGEVPDVQHDFFSIEVKHRARLPRWLHDAMSQAVAAQREGQLPVVVLHQSGERHDDDIVCMRLHDAALVVRWKRELLRTRAMLRELESRLREDTE